MFVLAFTIGGDFFAMITHCYPFVQHVCNIFGMVSMDRRYVFVEYYDFEEAHWCIGSLNQLTNAF